MDENDNGKELDLGNIDDFSNLTTEERESLLAQIGSDDSSDDIPFHPEQPLIYEGNELPPLPESMGYVPRKSWGALPPDDQMPLETPVKTLIFFMTGGSVCTTPLKCASRIRKIQKDQKKIHNYPDIPYNFMIGGDGRVYEGRSWEVEPDLPPYYQEYKDKCYSIGYIGKFCKKNPMSYDIQATTEAFVTYAVRAGYLVRHYEIIPPDETLENVPTQNKRYKPED